MFYTCNIPKHHNYYMCGTICHFTEQESSVIKPVRIVSLELDFKLLGKRINLFKPNLLEITVSINHWIED